MLISAKRPAGTVFPSTSVIGAVLTAPTMPVAPGIGSHSRPVQVWTSPKTSELPLAARMSTRMSPTLRLGTLTPFWLVVFLFWFSSRLKAMLPPTAARSKPMNAY